MSRAAKLVEMRHFGKCLMAAFAKVRFPKEICFANVRAFVTGALDMSLVKLSMRVIPIGCTWRLMEDRRVDGYITRQETNKVKSGNDLIQQKSTSY